MNINQMKDIVIQRLTENGYGKSTISRYSYFLRKICEFHKNQNIDDYTPESGQKYLDQKSSTIKKHSLDSYKAAVNQLNDVYYGNDFRYSHHRLPDLDPPSEYSELHYNYVQFVNSRRLSAKTVQNITRFSARFLKKLVNCNCLSVTEITPEIIFDVIGDEGTHFRSTIRNFLHFLYSESLIEWDLSVFVTSKGKTYKLPSYYTKEEQLQIQTDVVRNSKVAKRNNAIFLVGTRYGFRDKNITELKFDEVDFENATISLKQVKTGRYVSFPLYDSVKEALLDYINNERPNCDSDYIFISSFAPYRKLNAVYQIFRSSIKFAEIDRKGRTAGSKAVGRSAMATAMINNGVSYEVARAALGHSSNNAITSYASQDIESLRICAQPVEEPSGFFGKFLKGEEHI